MKPALSKHNGISIKKDTTKKYINHKSQTKYIKFIFFRKIRCERTVQWQMEWRRVRKISI